MNGRNEIRNKISSITNTQKITKAMQMVAASKMKKTQELMMASRPYANAIYKVISNLRISNLEYKISYLQERDIKRVGFLVISSNRGLCGCLNINLFKELLIKLNFWSKQNIPTDLAFIGSKGISFFKSLGVNILGQVDIIGDYPSLNKIIGIIQVIVQAYENGNIDKLYLVSNKFINTISYNPTIIQLLPLHNDDNRQETKKNICDYLYEPDLLSLIEPLISRYIESQVYQGLVENLASEQAARMVAMQAATDNGENLIKELKLIYNKARQERITQELIEIVSGASAV